MTILCDGISACSSSIMNIKDVDEFKLVCNSAQSCDELTVNITGENDYSEIYCQEFSATVTQI